MLKLGKLTQQTVNKTRKLTQAWTIITMISAFLWLVVSTKAGVWRDEFNDEALKGWTPMGEFFIWEVKDGFLHTKHVKPLPPKQKLQIEALQLITFPGPHQQLTITATNMKSHRGGGFGIALGKSFPDLPGAPPHYVFFTHLITAFRFSGTGGMAPFLWEPGRFPGTIWETRELRQMKLIFNTGRFQIYANEELRADFEDDHFNQIELIRFVMMGGEVPEAEGWADSFEIYDSAFSVEPKGKLTTTWGKMKGRH